jgi:hypothetical protein
MPVTYIFLEYNQDCTPPAIPGFYYTTVSEMGRWLVIRIPKTSFMSKGQHFASPILSLLNSRL